jgi:N6-adenosine-specific RNA methylase IME4
MSASRCTGTKSNVSHTAAADIATLTAEQRSVIAALGERQLLAAAKQISRERAERRRAERMAKIAAISAANSPLPQDRRYPIILADPPWRFEVYSRDTGLERSADAHYPTLTLNEIKALTIPAADDAVLFLWATVPMLLQAQEVLKAWGFRYVSNIAWIKDSIGTGFWVRNQHELLHIGKRGTIPAPRRRDVPPSVIIAPRREHSRKPDEVYQLIERMYPELPKLELFARGCREGWSAWGNEAGAR